MGFLFQMQEKCAIKRPNVHAFLASAISLSSCRGVFTCYFMPFSLGQRPEEGMPMGDGRPSHGPGARPLNSPCICFTSCTVLTNVLHPSWGQDEPGTSPSHGSPTVTPGCQAAPRGHILCTRTLGIWTRNGQVARPNALGHCQPRVEIDTTVSHPALVPGHNPVHDHAQAPASVMMDH